MGPTVKDLVTATENYVRESWSHKTGALMTAHGFSHVDRVRNWALVIARGERYADLEMVEVAALLHDIGLGQIEDGSPRTEHGPAGAEIAAEFLKGKSTLSAEQIGMITDAVRYHSLHPALVTEHLAAIGPKGKLIEIVRDADGLDAYGAVGLMRAFSSKYFLPEYDPSNIKGEAWGLSSAQFRERVTHELKGGRRDAPTMIDQVNQQIRGYDNLHTHTAKKLALPLIQFMKDFVLQIEHEITGS